MNRATAIFHKVSYLQYPLMGVAMLFALQPYFNGFEDVFGSFNKMLMFMGLSISFSTLQDTTKTQNKLSLRIYQNPTYSKYFLIYVGVMILFFIALGIIGLLGTENSKLQELSLGMIVMGIGMIGMLKSVFEMAKNHGTENT